MGLTGLMCPCQLETLLDGRIYAFSLASVPACGFSCHKLTRCRGCGNIAIRGERCPNVFWCNFAFTFLSMFLSTAVRLNQKVVLTQLAAKVLADHHLN